MKEPQIKSNVMKKLFFLFGIAATLSSCSRYYVSTLESPNTTKVDSTGVFKFENDSLAVTYNFHGEQAPISIEFYNKLNEPLYVNWKQSALIVGDKATSYSGDQITLSGNISGRALESYYMPQYTYQESKLEGTASLPPTVSFIPPKSRITKLTLKLTGVDYKAIADSIYKKKLITMTDGYSLRVREADFKYANSPLTFKSYLTLYTMHENTPKSFSLQQEFYVSNVTKSSINPKSMLHVDNKPGNVFYESESTAYGKTMAGVGVAALILVPAIAEAHKDKRQVN